MTSSLLFDNYVDLYCLAHSFFLVLSFFSGSKWQVLSETEQCFDTICISFHYLTLATVFACFEVLLCERKLWNPAQPFILSISCQHIYCWEPWPLSSWLSLVFPMSLSSALSQSHTTSRSLHSHVSRGLKTVLWKKTKKTFLASKHLKILS